MKALVEYFGVQDTNKGHSEVADLISSKAISPDLVVCLQL